MCVHRTEDGLCKLHSTDGITSSCVDCPCNDEVLTNADRIRAMSDEEMAHTILTVDFCEGCEHYAENGICLFILKHPNEPLYDGCKKALLDWLRKT